MSVLDRPSVLAAGGHETTRWANVAAIVPCYNEEDAIGPCVAALIDHGLGEVLVIDGGSTDQTVSRASSAGARVVVERQRGYGLALQTGILAARPSSEIFLFVDGDGSDCLEHAPALLELVSSGRTEFAIGSRLRGPREAGSLSLTQVVAGHLAGALIWARYGVRFTDMSPFRALRRETLARLGMREATYGWNLEMQMRVAAAHLSVVEIPVGQRRRVGGKSKVSGDLKSAATAAFVIARTFLRLARDLKKK